MGHLIIGKQLEAFHQSSDGANDLIRFRILDQAVIYRYDSMGAVLIHPGNDLLISCQRKGGGNLVAVVIRVSIPMIGSTEWNCFSSPSTCAA